MDPSAAAPEHPLHPRPFAQPGACKPQTCPCPRTACWVGPGLCARLQMAAAPVHPEAELSGESGKLCCAQLPSYSGPQQKAGPCYTPRLERHEEATVNLVFWEVLAEEMAGLWAQTLSWSEGAQGAVRARGLQNKGQEDSGEHAVR